MAELLIYIGPDNPVTGSIKNGDIVNVKPDGALWGKMEHIGNNYLVVKALLTAEQIAVILSPVPMGVVEGLNAFRRRFHVDYSGLDLDAVRASTWTVPTIGVDNILERVQA